MRIVVAPSGFKESLGSVEVARAIAAGIRSAAPEVVVEVVPVPDGGEGTAAMLADHTGGAVVPVEVTGPEGRPVRAHYALLGGPAPGTAAVDMASAAGLRLVAPEGRDPAVTTTRGVGELLSAVLDAGVARVVVGCGDSGTSDGGAGMLQALGARLLDDQGRDLPPGGAALLDLERVDTTGLDPRLAGVELRVAANPDNVLCGPRGVARRYGPQKGASPSQVAVLSRALEHWARILARDTPAGGIDLREDPCTGASGGLGAGLAALGASLSPRFEVLLDYVDLDTPLARADLAVTAEGAIDEHTFPGKTPAEVARRARRHGCPVVALAGTVAADGRTGAREAGIDACVGVLPAPVSVGEAQTRSAEFLTGASATMMRLLAVGTALRARS